MGIWRYNYIYMSIYVAPLHERQNKVCIYMRHLNASLLMYVTYFVYFQSNSFVGSLLLDLEFVRNCNQQEQDKTFTRNNPC